MTVFPNANENTLSQQTVLYTMFLGGGFQNSEHYNKHNKIP